MRHLTASALLLITTGCFFAGCERGTETEPALVPATRTSPAAERAIGAIAAARCDHEQRCNRVGPTAKYMSREHCMNVMLGDAYDKYSQCRLGVNQKDLHECLTSIGDEDCNGTIDKIERKVACRADDLCIE